MVRFAEALEVNNFPLPEELDNVVDIRVVTHAENVVVGNAGFLLRRQILSQVCDHVPGDLHCGGAPRRAGGGSGVNAGRMIQEVCVKQQMSERSVYDYLKRLQQWKLIRKVRHGVYQKI